MGGKASRDKGARGELAVIAMLRDNLGLTLNRNYKQTAQAQHGDIEQLVGGYLIEVKNSPDGISNIKAWWRQAVTAAEKVGAVPCLAHNLGCGRWRFMVPIPQAWSSGHQWSREIQYTQTLYPDGFYLLVREHS